MEALAHISTLDAYHNCLVEGGALPVLVKVMQGAPPEHSRGPRVAFATQALANIATSETLRERVVEEALPALVQVLREDDAVAGYVAEALAKISASDTFHDRLVDEGALPELVQLLGMTLPGNKTAKEVATVIAKITTTSGAHHDRLVEVGALPALLRSVVENDDEDDEDEDYPRQKSLDALLNLSSSPTARVALRDGDAFTKLCVARYKFREEEELVDCIDKVLSTLDTNNTESRCITCDRVCVQECCDSCKEKEDHEFPRRKKLRSE